MAVLARGRPAAFSMITDTFQGICLGGFLSGIMEKGGAGGSKSLCQRIYEQVQIVDQAVGEHRPDQGAAAADVDVAIDPLLEAADRVRTIGAKDGRVVPLGGLQRAGDDVLGRLVHERRTGVLLGGPGGPRRGEFLKGAAAQQDRLARPHDRADGLTHLGIERVLHRPGRRVDNTIQRDELMYPNRAHSHHLLPRFGPNSACSHKWTEPARGTHRRWRGHGFSPLARRSSS